MLPSDTAITEVMRATGMDRMQAINHLRGRAWLAQLATHAVPPHHQHRHRRHTDAPAQATTPAPGTPKE